MYFAHFGTLSALAVEQMPEGNTLAKEVSGIESIYPKPSPLSKYAGFIIIKRKMIQVMVKVLCNFCLGAVSINVCKAQPLSEPLPLRNKNKWSSQKLSV